MPRALYMRKTDAITAESADQVATSRRSTLYVSPQLVYVVTLATVQGVELELTENRMRKLSRRLLISASSLLVVGVACADDDPTFNGLVKSLQCMYTVQSVCTPDGYCVATKQSIVPIVGITYDISKGTVYSTGTVQQRLISGVQLRFTKISEAKLNSLLSFRFDFTQEGKNYKAMVLLVPTPRGMYQYNVTTGLAMDVEDNNKGALYGSCQLNPPLYYPPQRTSGRGAIRHSHNARRQESFF
jgi:hypothetical protein